MIPLNIRFLTPLRILLMSIIQGQVFSDTGGDAGILEPQ